MHLFGTSENKANIREHATCLYGKQVDPLVGWCHLKIWQWKQQVTDWEITVNTSFLSRERSFTCPILFHVLRLLSHFISYCKEASLPFVFWNNSCHCSPSPSRLSTFFFCLFRLLACLLWNSEIRTDKITHLGHSCCPRGNASESPLVTNKTNVHTLY